MASNNARKKYRKQKSVTTLPIAPPKKWQQSFLTYWKRSLLARNIIVPRWEYFFMACIVSMLSNNIGPINITVYL